MKTMKKSKLGNSDALNKTTRKRRKRPVHKDNEIAQNEVSYNSKD